MKIVNFKIGYVFNMSVGQHTKISAIIYLTQTLKKEIDESGLQDPLLIRLTTILNHLKKLFYLLVQPFL